MTTARPTCYDGDIGIALIKNGRELKFAGASISRVEYSRELDAISSATVNLITPGADCCGLLGVADHYNTELIIFQTNPITARDEVVWRGPCFTVDYGRGVVDIVAKDVLHWLEVRRIEVDYNFVRADVSDIFVELATYALEKDPTHQPTYSFVTSKSGVLEDRLVEAASGRMAWAVSGEMLQSGLDVTTFGSRIIVGLPAFTPLTLKDTDVLGEVRVTKDGADFANHVFANASRDIVGTYPPGPAAGSNGYPLVETTISDSQLQDVASAQAAARARYDFSAGGVRRVNASGGLVLLPSSGIDPRTLVAGQLFNFQATESCYGAEETLRLGRLTVVSEEGVRTSTIELQPTGTLPGASDAA